MGIIHLLTDDVINKIAAGEVIERPSSIVKELVENALDAGADEVVVELEEGGIRRITVRDNGAGMERDDAELALKRHATSKIARAEELFTVHTKGFRGEALASISAVSHLQLRTQPRSGSVGTSISCRGGAVEGITDWSGSNGTEITVTELFYNIPARSAFLKSAASEYANCLEVLQSLAVISAGVSFKLLHNGKEKLRVEKTAPTSDGMLGESDLRTRASAIFETDVVQSLMYGHKISEMVALEILTSPPGLTRGAQKFITTYVNGRIVKDRGLKSAIIRGYHSHLLPGQFPLSILNLRVNPSLVDVNVHPAKTEIRLQYASDIQSTVAIAVRELLRKQDWAQMQPAEVTPRTDTYRPQIDAYRAAASEYSNERRSTNPPAPVYRASEIRGSSERFGERHTPKFAPSIERSVSQVPGAKDLGELFANLSSSSESASAARIPWADLRPIGSAFDCYLFFEADDRMLVLDQHAFHERILYERLLNDRAQLIRSQPLLVPEAVDFTPTDLEALMERQTMLLELGFEFEKVSAATVEVRAVPSLLIRRNIESVLTAIVSQSELNLNDPAAGEMHEILSTIACHSAVRAGEQLSPAELQQLQAQAETVDFYHNCPHGRRVFKWWSESQVAGWFDR